MEVSTVHVLPLAEITKSLWAFVAPKPTSDQIHVEGVTIETIEIEGALA